MRPCIKVNERRPYNGGDGRYAERLHARRSFSLPNARSRKCPREHATTTGRFRVVRTPRAQDASNPATSRTQSFLIVSFWLKSSSVATIFSDVKSKKIAILFSLFYPAFLFYQPSFSLIFPFSINPLSNCGSNESQMKRRANERAVLVRSLP